MLISLLIALLLVPVCYLVTGSVFALLISGDPQD